MALYIHTYRICWLNNLCLSNIVFSPHKKRQRKIKFEFDCLNNIIRYLPVPIKLFFSWGRSEEEQIASNSLENKKIPVLTLCWGPSYDVSWEIRQVVIYCKLILLRKRFISFLFPCSEAIAIIAFVHYSEYVEIFCFS